MRSFNKCKFALGILLLVCTAVLPPANAQSGAVPRMFQLDADGAYLGIHMIDVTSDNMSRYKLSNEAGIIVHSVVEGSPAETATASPPRSTATTRHPMI